MRRSESWRQLQFKLLCSRSAWAPCPLVGVKAAVLRKVRRTMELKVADMCSAGFGHLEKLRGCSSLVFRCLSYYLMGSILCSGGIHVQNCKASCYKAQCMQMYLHMNHSLNSVKGLYRGIVLLGSILGFIKGDTRSSDYSSHV